MQKKLRITSCIVELIFFHASIVLRYLSREREITRENV